MTFLFLDGGALAELVPIELAIEALEAAFTGEVPDAVPRVHVPVGEATLLLMPAAGPQGAGVKLVTVNPANPARGRPLIHALYTLLDPDSLEPLALIDGAELTAIRTAAVSGVATRRLARSGARHLVLFGAGVQARSHLAAMRAVCPIEKVTVVSRSVERAADLVRRARAGGIESELGDPRAIRDGDVVCTCTTSPVPVFDGELLPPGCHVNAIGSYQPHTREVDDRTVAQARVVVESRRAAWAEAGDLLIPLEGGSIAESHVVADLHELVTGAPVRLSDDDVTLFKSVGLAFEDLVLARLAFDRSTSS
ncbi:MAG: ornithine cyclodeaminase family protein [Actinomycetota bacterium]|nr:ornithine cyclodeaminase family protein [Actinomycetota bacterium]